MPIKLPMPLRVLNLKLSTLAAPFFKVPATISQAVTYKEGFKLPKYSSIPELGAAVAKLRWTEDPWDGKLDIIKHPTFMQQAIEQHPEYSGDCDDVAAYFCVALAKAGLAAEQWFVTAIWSEPAQDGFAGHAACVFRVGEKWYCVSNWNPNGPTEINGPGGYVAEFERIMRREVVVAVMYKASTRFDDSLVLGETKVVKR